VFYLFFQKNILITFEEIISLKEQQTFYGSQIKTPNLGARPNSFVFARIPREVIQSNSQKPITDQIDLFSVRLS